MCWCAASTEQPACRCREEDPLQTWCPQFSHWYTLRTGTWFVMSGVSRLSGVYCVSLFTLPAIFPLLRSLFQLLSLSLPPSLPPSLTHSLHPSISFPLSPSISSPLSPAQLSLSHSLSLVNSHTQTHTTDNILGSAACFLPAPCHPLDQDAALGVLHTRGAVDPDTRSAGGAGGCAGGMRDGDDGFVGVRRRRSHLIYRALQAPVRAPDMMLVCASRLSRLTRPSNVIRPTRPRRG